MVKKIFCISILTLVLFVFVSCSRNNIVTEYAMESYIPLCINSLVDLSTHIVKAEIVDSRGEDINISLTGFTDSYLIHTVYRLRVTAVYYGDVAIGDIIEAAQMGGRYRNRELIVEHLYTPLSDGDEIIFFLKCFNATWGTQLPMAIVQPFQGLFYPAPPNARGEVVLQTVGERTHYHLPLTVGHLERIADGTFWSAPSQTPIPQQSISEN